MQKTWNLTYYRDGKPAVERTGVSHQDAVVELFRLARGEAPADPVAVELEQIAAPAETGELSLVA
ncbi:MAG TPA: hypothetical protein VHB53_09010 [Solirubrobacterales bacterium]|nr:hypothetical protein [Solirubrobacterales bacterium]